MNADVKATCLAAIETAEIVATKESAHAGLLIHRLTELQAAREAIAALEVDAPQGSWQRMTLPDSDEARQLWSRLLAAIDLTGKYGPYAICRRVDNPAPQVSEGMDMPDGVGDWWFEGYHEDNERAEIYRTHYLVIDKDGALTISFGEGLDYWPVEGHIGKWWPAVTPWSNATQPEEGES